MACPSRCLGRMACRAVSRDAHQVVTFVAWLLVMWSCVSSAVWGQISAGSPLLVRGDEAFPPYEFVGPDGIPTGYNVDMIRAVAEAMGLEIRVDLGPWSEVRRQLEEGRIDALAGMFHSQARDRLVDFSSPHLVVTHAVFVRSGSRVRSLTEIDGGEVIVQAGDIMDDFARERLPGARIVGVASPGQALGMLSAGEGDCALLAKLQGLYLADGAGLTNIRAVGPPIVPQRYCFAVREGNQELLAVLNEGLAIVNRAGDAERIYQKWFGTYDRRENLAAMLRYGLWALVPLFLVLGLALGWSWSLRRQVSLRTAELRQELEHRQQAEDARRQLEQRIRRAQRLESLGVLAGGVAHDFNNILGAIMGHAELAALGLPPSDPAVRHLEHVLRGTERARELVQRILAFSRQTERTRQPVALQVAIREALQLVRASTPSTIEIEADIAPECAPVLADPVDIHQVVMNLCSNAAQAIGEATGTIRVELAETVVSAGGEGGATPEPGRYARITVSDTGVGMDAETRERIFDPFFTTKGPGKGTGLGLSMVYGVVTDYDGAISVDSQPGTGTTFSILLPCTEQDVAAPASQVPQPQGHGEQVLLVDDEGSLASATAQALEAVGYRVVVQDSPIEALETFNERPASFSAVITDHTMPGMTGVEMAKEMLRVRPELPVMLITGFGQREIAQRARSAGIRTILAKPYSSRELVEALQETLRGLDGEASG